MTTDVAVIAGGLKKSFGATPALRGLDLRIRTGEIYGLLGPNGSGKTTRVRCVAEALRAVTRDGRGRRRIDQARGRVAKTLDCPRSVTRV